MPNIGPTELLIGVFLLALVVAAVFVGVKLAMRSSKKS